MMNRLRGNGLYMSDGLGVARLHELVQQGTQFIIVTHSLIIMAYPDSVIYDDGGGTKK